MGYGTPRNFVKNTAVIELHSFAITISNMLKTTSSYCYPFSRAQHATQRTVSFLFDRAFRKCIFSLNSRPEQHTRQNKNQRKVVKLCCLFVGGCWLALREFEYLLSRSESTNPWTREKAIELVWFHLVAIEAI